MGHRCKLAGLDEQNEVAQCRHDQGERRYFDSRDCRAPGRETRCQHMKVHLDLLGEKGAVVPERNGEPAIGLQDSVGTLDQLLSRSFSGSPSLDRIVIPTGSAPA